VENEEEEKEEKAKSKCSKFGADPDQLRSKEDPAEVENADSGRMARA